MTTRTTLIGDPQPTDEALAEMQTARKEIGPGTYWAAYQNHDLGSSDLGSLRFLAVGPNCTFSEFPRRYPDTAAGPGWQCIFVGWVDLSTGRIVPKEELTSPPES